MYGGALPPGALTGWILLGVTVVALAARAVRVETRSARRGRVRVLDRALDLAAAVAVLALVVVLAGVVVDGIGGAG